MFYRESDDLVTHIIEMSNDLVYIYRERVMSWLKESRKQSDTIEMSGDFVTYISGRSNDLGAYFIEMSGDLVTCSIETSNDLVTDFIQMGDDLVTCIMEMSDDFVTS